MTKEWKHRGLDSDNASISSEIIPQNIDLSVDINSDYPQGTITKEDRKVFLLGAGDRCIKANNLDGFWAGSAQFATAPFSVSLAGVCNISALTVGILTVNTGIIPDANDGAYLGTGALGFSDLFLASGGVINWANGNTTLTHSTGLLTSNVPLTVSGHLIAVHATNPYIELSKTDATARISYIQIASDLLNITHNSISVLDISTAGVMAINVGLTPDANDGAYLGTGALGFSDLFLASGGVVNWANGDVTVIHSSGALSITGTITLTSLAGSGTRVVEASSAGVLSATRTLGLLSAVGSTSQQITNSGQTAYQVITHNLGVVPKLIKIYASATGGNRVSDSHGVSFTGGSVAEGLGQCVYNYYSVTIPISEYYPNGRIIILDNNGTQTSARMDASDTTTLTLRWYDYNNLWGTDANMIWEAYA